FHYGILSGMDAEAARRSIPLVLEKVGLAKAGTKELRHYSKGMLQRIGIAQAILHDPEVLVLDEPMSGLDPGGRRDMREMIRALARDGKTVLLTSHVLEDVAAVCDQVGVIIGG